MKTFLKKLFNRNQKNVALRTNVYIYGAGGAGKELYDLLLASKKFTCLAFIDDNPDKQKSIFSSLKVLTPKQACEQLNSDDVQEIWLAMANIDIGRAQQIARMYRAYDVDVKSIPGFSSILLNGELNSSENISLNRILEREPVDSDFEAVKPLIYGQSILVTGAGGSIGSELCRIIMNYSPRKLILLDMSEYALFEIEKELNTFCHAEGINTMLIPVLSSANDSTLMVSLLDYHEVHAVFHAAAYKHVRLVELNIIKGISNNIFSTKSVIDSVKKSTVKYCVLVSSDKAVRPSNVMGATKRVSELMFQNAATSNSGCIFTAVRFGNVLGSSGSVIPIFKKQILAGGPVTVTHSEVTRYFMTINEAANLITSAAAMAKGGEIFVLDMGEPVRIVHLAKKLIGLLGYSVDAADSNHIPIQFVGLSAGEKLHEELVISGQTENTNHPKIFRVIEPSLEENQLKEMLDSFLSAIESSNEEAAKAVLLQHFPSLNL